MNHTIILYILILIAITIVFGKIFCDDLLKVLKAILFIFIPYGLIMWISEIFISKRVTLLQFGFIYSALSLSLLFITWLFYKFKERQQRNASGRVMGVVYLFIFVLLLLGIIFGKAFIDTYIRHIYLMP